MNAMQLSMFDYLAENHPSPDPATCGPLMWPGGKAKMTARVLPLINIGTDGYVEPYCGGASIFFAKELNKHEVLNDFHGELINFFRVLQDPKASVRLVERLALTPYSLDEFKLALSVNENDDPETRAWAMFVRCNQGFSGSANSIGDWSRSFTSATRMSTRLSAWRTRILRLKHQAERLSRAFIDNRCALECIEYWQRKNALIYIDPPYVHETRKDTKIYKHEVNNDHHRKLVEILLNVSSVVVLSGYDNEIYNPLSFAGWRKFTFKTVCWMSRNHGELCENSHRTECVWISPNHPAALLGWNDD